MLFALVRKLRGTRNRILVKALRLIYPSLSNLSLRLDPVGQTTTNYLLRLQCKFEHASITRRNAGSRANPEPEGLANIISFAGFEHQSLGRMPLAIKERR
jgi:hypothetical protein